MKNLCFTLLAVLLSFASFAVSPITGSTNVCAGGTSTVTLFDLTPGGTWSSSITSIAIIDSSSGVATGVSAGTATITYDVSGAYVTITVTVNPLPSAITGMGPICVGSCIALSDAVTGGTWISNNGTIASAGLSSGLVCGISAGVDTITYALATGCIATASVIVNPLPSAIGGVTGVCIGSTIVLTDATAGGTWSSSNTAASVTAGSGIVTGLSAGAPLISYTLPTGCAATYSINVYNNPAPIAGITSICIGATTTLSDATLGGTWSASITSIASIIVSGGSAGKTTGVSAGTAIVTYRVFTTGCMTTTMVTVGSITPITGTASLCIGATTPLTDATSGGTWSTISSNVTVGAVSGIVTGLSFGTATITYTNGCTATHTVTVYPAPSSISGFTSMCVGSTTTLSDAVPGGTWTSSNTTIATIGAGTGVVMGLSIGSATITYGIGAFCLVTTTIHVVAAPGAILGGSAACVGSTITLSDAVVGGSWTSGNSAIASITITGGLVTGASPGTATITYSLGTGCTVSKTFTAVSAVTLISGSTSICTGSSATLSDATGGGSWSSSNTAIAPVGITSGVVAGISSGTTIITYSLGASCTATVTFTVDPVPSSILGVANVCIGSTTTLSDVVSGGAWSSDNTAIATIGASSGIATGVSSGTANISYTLGGGCSVSIPVTVNVSPSAISGLSSICMGATTTLSDAGGGTWSSSSSAIASVGLATGIVTGASAGSAIITYTLPTGCITTFIDTVLAVITPSVSVSASPGTTVCPGTTVTFTATPTGGGSPVYGWEVNGIWAGAIGSTYSYVPLSGDVVAVAMGSSYVCRSADTVFASDSMTIDNPSITASAAPTGCGESVTLTAGGATTYLWSPSAGLSCSTCAVATLIPTVTATYTVTGTDALGCSNTNTVTVNGNRISGYITFSSATPDTLDMKVWLIQFNPTDSSITALDSTTTCAVDSMGYYEFDGKAAGNYMVKAKLLYGNPVGGSGYVPTYSLSSPNWYSAATAAHTTGTDTLHINMMYGTVPAGPGFISGYVYSGAGKGTSGDVPVAGMQIYLENTATNILTEVYTDPAGLYSFGSLAYGDYIIYPEDYLYHTTPSSVITLSPATPGIGNIDFKQYTTSKTIVPIVTTGVKIITATNGLNIYPNPTTGILNIQWNNQPAGNAAIQIIDITGREVYKTTVNMNTTSGLSEINAESLKEGIYFITIKSDNIYYTAKLMIQQ